MIMQMKVESDKVKSDKVHGNKMSNQLNFRFD